MIPSTLVVIIMFILRKEEETVDENFYIIS